MKLKVSAGGLPVGSYLGKFLGVEPVNNDYGAGLCWRWEITAGPHAGQKVSRITGADPSPKNTCGRILAGLTGKALSAGDEFEPGGYVGKVYILVVTQGQRGGSKVESLDAAPVG